MTWKGVRHIFSFNFKPEDSADGRCLGDGRSDVQPCSPVLTSGFTDGLLNLRASVSLLEVLSVENIIHVATFFFFLNEDMLGFLSLQDLEIQLGLA